MSAVSAGARRSTRRGRATRTGTGSACDRSACFCADRRIGRNRGFKFLSENRFPRYEIPEKLGFARCIVDECERDAYVRGLCGGHWQRQQVGSTRTGPIRRKAKNGEGVARNDDGEKYCRWGNHWRPEAEFHTDRHARDGLSPVCKSCRREQKYGLPGGSIDGLLLAQGGGCGVCGTTQPGGKGWCVDHDHACCPGANSCGACVRGVLCENCNVGLGNFRDDVSILEAAVRYLNAT